MNLKTIKRERGKGNDTQIWDVLISKKILRELYSSSYFRIVFPVDDNTKSVDVRFCYKPTIIYADNKPITLPQTIDTLKKQRISFKDRLKILITGQIPKTYEINLYEDNRQN